MPSLWPTSTCLSFSEPACPPCQVSTDASLHPAATVSPHIPAHQTLAYESMVLGRSMRAIAIQKAGAWPTAAMCSTIASPPC